MNGLIDSHCHLDRFSEEERAPLLDRAAEAGIVGMVTIGTRFSESHLVRAIARTGHAGAKLWCTIGTHPDHVEDESPVDAESLAAEASSAEVVGIGESGLDYTASTADARRQRASFLTHIRASQMSGLPLVIHARGADDDIGQMLVSESRREPFAFVLHCFTSGVELARTAIDLGGYVSFSGILTFPKSEALRTIAASLPHDRLLIETDSPFLAPVPKRGRRNEPGFLPHTASVLAAAIGQTTDELATTTSANFRRLFTKAA